MATSRCGQRLGSDGGPAAHRHDAKGGPDVDESSCRDIRRNDEDYARKRSDRVDVTYDQMLRLVEKAVGSEGLGWGMSGGVPTGVAETLLRAPPASSSDLRAMSVASPPVTGASVLDSRLRPRQKPEEPRQRDGYVILYYVIL